MQHAIFGLLPEGSIIDLSFVCLLYVKRSCVVCGRYQVRKVGTNRQLSLRLQAMK